MRGRSGHAWRELVRLLCPPGSYCQVDECVYPSREILYDLRPRHPQGPSLDHIVELWEGGAAEDPANLQPAHLRCNVIKSNRRRAEHRATLTRTRQRATRLVAMDEQPRPKRSAQAFTSD